MRRGRSRRRPWRTLHRRAGAASAVLLALIASTGLLLNHSDELGLARRYVEADWLLDLYGTQLPPAPTGYPAGAHWVSSLGERVFLDDLPLEGLAGELVGAVDLGEELAVATGAGLWLVSEGGQLLERQDRASGLPGVPLALGRTGDGRLALRTPSGPYAAPVEGLAWAAVTDEATIHWAQAALPPPALGARLLRLYRSRGLSLERVLLDVHSGRILGRRGQYLADAIAATCVLLALSGLWLWLKHRP